MSMKFKIGNTRVHLQGDPSLCKTQVSLWSIIRTIHHEGQGILLDFGQLSVLPVEGASSTPESLPQFTLPKIEKLMENFSDLFSTPFGLPPAWAHDHAIVLKEGTSPISVRPYRYPQIVKDEIERTMAKMLTAGTIQPSTSPFSSLVLLVKKRDGSWRFCVDYRALK